MSLPNEMWAHSLTAPSRFERVRVSTGPTANLEDGEVILRTLAGGVCGSDLPYFRGQLPLPWGAAPTAQIARSPGFPMHEVVGEVVTTTTAQLEVGMKVVGWASRSNGLAEYVRTAAAGLAPYDTTMTPGTAVMLQPLACVLDAVARMPSLEGRDVAVLGLGPIGLLFGHIARRRGARRVLGIDRVPRDDLREEFGFDETIHSASATWAESLSDAERPDILIEAVGHQQSTFGHAAEALAHNGLLYYFGIPDDLHYTVPMQTMLRKNLTVMTGITVKKQAALRSAGVYVVEHPALAERYITDRFRFQDATSAYEVAGNPSPGRIKVVLETD